MIDHLNDKDAIAQMRSKNQTLNPLEDTSPIARTFIKIFNIAGSACFSDFIWFWFWARRSSRKKSIKLQFQK